MVTSGLNCDSHRIHLKHQMPNISVASDCLWRTWKTLFVTPHGPFELRSGLNLIIPANVPDFVLLLEDYFGDGRIRPTSVLSVNTDLTSSMKRRQEAEEAWNSWITPVLQKRHKGVQMKQIQDQEKS